MTSTIRVDLAATAYTAGQIDTWEKELPGPRIAVAGRSNVGKSSLLNMMAARKALARVSASPGKTVSVNYFKVEPGAFFLVDLPGYGYARRSKEQRKEFGRLIERLLTSEAWPMAIAVLLDARHEPQRLDLDMLSYCQALGLPIIGVMTKADKCKQNERAARLKQWQALFPQAAFVVTSAKSSQGRDELWKLFNDTAVFLREMAPKAKVAAPALPELVPEPEDAEGPEHAPKGSGAAAARCVKKVAAVKARTGGRGKDAPAPGKPGGARVPAGRRGRGSAPADQKSAGRTRSRQGRG